MKDSRVAYFYARARKYVRAARTLIGFARESALRNARDFRDLARQTRARASEIG